MLTEYTEVFRICVDASFYTLLSCEPLESLAAQVPADPKLKRAWRYGDASEGITDDECGTRGSAIPSK